MKSKLLASIIIATTTLGLSGCVLNVGDHKSAKNHDYWEVQQEKNRANLTKLSMGMTKEQVLVIMGTADFTEAYLSNDGDAKQEVQVYFYRTQWTKGDGKTTKDECTPVVLRDNALVGWGDSAYKQI
ncbi:DUF3192 domain-containing protein [Shewanella sp. WXL01]|uniref:DUF3192 domain-containing protein n=1 Tax=Shewanella maritima TaxID=2520507 RepID=A0A411PKK7_9GAMM|nr:MULTISPECIES: DUF3192 domain-containing protein [Shewanella]NKF51094.1 DUF3192 domain-containing protein [Shewanella sp. WXL01]QBF84051.1 DUF3192 domain-containing protein [Shewanella maritima]